jgi:hypothetical protein
MVCDLIIPIHVFLLCSSSNCHHIHDLAPLIVVFLLSQVLVAMWFMVIFFLFVVLLYA